MNLDKRVNCSIFSQTLRFVRRAQSAQVRSFMWLCLALAQVSCTTLPVRNASSTASTASPTPARPASQAATAIPVLETVSSAEQQALIDAINRDGRASQFNGFREPVPSPEVAVGDDVVELNYEQAELRLVLEELADALDITLVIDPSIDSQISIRTSPNRPLQRDDVWAPDPAAEPRRRRDFGTGRRAVECATCGV